MKLINKIKTSKKSTEIQPSVALKEQDADTYITPHRMDKNIAVLKECLPSEEYEFGRLEPEFSRGIILTADECKERFKFRENIELLAVVHLGPKASPALDASAVYIFRDVLPDSQVQSISFYMVDEANLDQDEGTSIGEVAAQFSRGQSIVLGRNNETKDSFKDNIRLPDTVSREHVKVSFYGSGVGIHDLDSTNGTNVLGVLHKTITLPKQD